MCVHRFGFDSDRFAHEMLGLLEPASLSAKESQAIECVEIFGIPSQDILIKPLGPIVVTRTVQLPGFFQQNLTHGKARPWSRCSRHREIDRTEPATCALPHRRVGGFEMTRDARRVKQRARLPIS